MIVLDGVAVDRVACGNTGLLGWAVRQRLGNERATGFLETQNVGPASRLSATLAAAAWADTTDDVNGQYIVTKIEKATAATHNMPEGRCRPRRDSIQILEVPDDRRDFG